MKQEINYKKGLTKNILLSVILLILMTVAVSWHLKVLFLYFLFLVVRKYFLAAQTKKVNFGVFTLFLISFIIAFPNISSSDDDNIQSIYFDKKTKEEISIPIIPYLTNFIGEGDITAVVTVFSKLIPLKTAFAITNKLLPKRNKYVVKPLKDALFYLKRTAFFKNNLQRPYREMNIESPPHNLTFQILKGIGWYKNTDHYFLHIPKNKKVEDCQVIVFCHGYAGNWIQYSYQLAKYTDAIIIAVETPDFNGFFNRKVMKNIIQQVIPHAFNHMGIPVKKTHLIGLSNGGSAINTMLSQKNKIFKTYTILSASINNYPKYTNRVNAIYGSKDRSGGVSKKIPKSKYKKYVFKGENHALLISRPDTVYAIINKIISKP